VGFKLKVRVLVMLIGVCVSIVAEPAAEPPETIVENYCAASRGQEQAFQGASMDVEIQASLPKLKAALLTKCCGSRATARSRTR
jgi:hypothetical protein